MARKAASALLFLLLATTSVLSASFAAGVHRKLIADCAVQDESSMKEFPTKLLSSHKIAIAHPRILTVRTNDYGSYDPSPTLDKPSFKQIPN